MRSLLRAVALSAFLLPACASESATMGELAPDDRAVLERMAAMDTEMVLSRDWNALAARFTEDAVRMPPNGPELHGRTAIRESLEMMPPIQAFSFRMTSLDGNATLAYMRAEWSYTLAPPGADPIVDAGKILIVFEKQSSGEWLTVADAWNSNNPAGS